MEGSAVYANFKAFAGIVLAAVLLASCRTTTKEEAPVVEEKVETAELVSTPYTIKRIHENLPYLNTDIVYPFFEKDTVLNDAINTKIIEPYNEFRYDAKLEWQDMDEFRQLEFGSEGITPPFEYTGSFEYALSNDICSVVFAVYNFSGGAHGNTEMMSINRDMKTGRSVSVTEASGLSVSRIAALCRELLEKKLLSSGTSQDDIRLNAIRKKDIEAGTAAAEENFDCFKIEDGVLTIYFDPYTVSSYADGVQKVDIKL